MDNLWTRRSNNGKLSLSTGNAGANGAPPQNDHPTRNYTLGRRGDVSSHSNKNPFNSPAIASPTAGASSAFGLGSGAFASFGASKTPKTPGSALDFGGVVGSSAKTPTAEKPQRSMGPNVSKASLPGEYSEATGTIPPNFHFKDSWVFWVRPPISKSNGYVVDYEKTLHAMSAPLDNLDDFMLFKSHLKLPSTLPHVTDYHFFKTGIRPIWEDDDNKNGGKWVVRLRKDIKVADLYWDNLLFGIIGNHFDDVSDEICGVVLSVRNGEDILSIWTRSDNRTNLKVKEAAKAVLECPSNTIWEYKSHNSSLQQRAAADDARKSNQHNHNSSVNSRNGNKDDEKTPSSDKKRAS